MDDAVKIKRALFSCWDKTGIAELAGALHNAGVEIVSSGGTARHLIEHGIPVQKVEEITGFPEILDGRVKTLHPMIHAAILARRTPEHLAQLEKHHIRPLDMVVVNLYPFLRYTDSDKDENEMVELIDIGGPAMLRAAAKNFAHVVALHRPDQYREFLEVWEESGGKIPFSYRKKWAVQAFFYTAYYDGQISAYFASQTDSEGFPHYFSEFYEKESDLRYGENPHQSAALYQPYGVPELPRLKQLWGKEMSFNNYGDVVSAFQLVSEFDVPAAVVVKHANPCGAAVDSGLSRAFQRALAGDPVSAFGGIIACNRELDRATAEIISQSFFECVIAPKYSEAALSLLKKKKNLRILLPENWAQINRGMEMKHLPVGLLVQTADAVDFDPDRLQVVTKRTPDTREMDDLLFAWKVVKYVKSNAIVFVKERQLIGVGAGQMSRVDAVKLARQKAQEAGHELTGAVMASDAFFPFRDGIDRAAEAGITAVIQPGGSIRDREVTEAADEHKMAMLFTGIRHFKH